MELALVVSFIIRLCRKFRTDLCMAAGRLELAAPQWVDMSDATSLTLSHLVWHRCLETEKMALFHRSPGDLIQVHGSPGTEVVSSTSLALVARSITSEGTMRKWELNPDHRIYVIWDAQACCQCEVSGWRCPCKLISPQSRENYAPLTARCRQVFACLAPSQHSG